MYCILDFETRSPCDISAKGAWNYSKHPQTEILCASAWDSVSKSVHTWEVDYFEDPPKWFTDVLRNSERWVAHNAFFEIAMWKNSLAKSFPDLPCPSLDRWVDTRAIALHWSLPKSLDGASRVLGRELKDKEGSRLMLKMCKPRRPSKSNKDKYHWTRADMDRLMQYCEQDVIATKELLHTLGNLQKCERPIFELDKQINHRGFAVDLELAKAAYTMAQSLAADAEKELGEITGGFITTPNQHARFKKFAQQHGIKMASTDKEAVAELLKRSDLPPVIRRVFEIRQELGKASVAKYAKCLNNADHETGRLYDTFVYHKASTGRWAGQGFQPQNLPRGELGLKADKVDQAISAVKCGDVETVATIGPPMQVLSDLLRPVICAPEGKKLVTADFEGVEARGALWLANDKEALDSIARGEHQYKKMAERIFGTPWPDVQKGTVEYHIGKGAFLGCTYGMGDDKFSAQNKVDLVLAHKAVSVYRESFPGVPKLWYGLEKALKNCIRYKTKTSYGLFSFYWKTDRVVAYVLPSGREIHYWDPTVDYSGGIKYWTVSGTTGKWIQVDTWGGKILENGDSGMCSCLLRRAMRHLDKASGWDIVMSVHDELVCETPDLPEYNVDKMNALMVGDLPAWAKGFPLSAEGWEGQRFRK
jgi:DNA polymerase bacteriophage-type